MPSPLRRGSAAGTPERARAFRLAAAGAALAVLALAGSAALTLSYALSPEAFAAMAGEGFEGELSVEHVALELHPRPWIRVEGLAIEGLGTAEAAWIKLRLRPLLRGKVRARLVRLEGPHLVLHRGPDGDFLPIFGNAFGNPGGGPGLAALPRFEAERGGVRIVQGEKLTAVVRLETLSLGFFDAERKAELLITGDVTAGDGKWHTRPLQVSGLLVHAGGRLAVREGVARARHVGIQWWRGEEARARFSYQDGVVRIASLDVRAYDGRWHATGGWRLRDGMQLDLAVRAEGVHLSRVAADASPDSSPGDLGVFEMRWPALRIPWHHGPRWERSTGRGELRVSGGMLPGHSLLARAVGAEVGPSAVSFLSAPVELRDGALHSEEVRLESEDYVLAASGTLAIDSHLDLDGRARLTWTVLPPIPVSIGGRLMQPTVDAHPSRLPASSVGALATGVIKTGRGVLGVLGALGTASEKPTD